jgi:hypothetical protein
MAENETNEQLVTQLAERSAAAVVHVAFDPKERCKWLRRSIPVSAMLLGAAGPWLDHLLAQLRAVISGQ